MKNRDFIRLVDTIIQRSTDRHISEKLENIRSYAVRCCISYSDRNYVNDLARKFEIVHNIEVEPQTAPPTDNDGVQGCSNNSGTLLRKRLFLAEQRIYELEDTIRDMRNAKPEHHEPLFTSDAIADVRKVFAKMYHPDTIKCEGIERSIRTEIFKEFWEELKKIELSHKR